MHVYNAIVVMKEILGVFPLSSTSEAAGVAIDQAIDKFLEDETRGDLKILAKSYVVNHVLPLVPEPGLDILLV